MYANFVESPEAELRRKGLVRSSQNSVKRKSNFREFTFYAFDEYRPYYEEAREGRTPSYRSSPHGTKLPPSRLT